MLSKAFTLLNKAAACLAPGHAEQRNVRMRADQCLSCGKANEASGKLLRQRQSLRCVADISALCVTR